MITRDDSRAALIRFDQVLDILIAGGIVISVRDGWRREWIDTFHGMASWSRIVFNAQYGDMPLRMEVCRESEDDYRFSVQLFRRDNNWTSAWTIEVWPMLGLKDKGFKFDVLFHPEQYDVPF